MTTNPQLLTTDIPEDISGWWVSEKYDGVRAIWDGKNLLTRHGKRLNPPAWFVAELPNVRLDGELWMGRGTFDALRSNIQTKGSNWDGVKFMVFDLAEEGEFEDRNDKLMSMSELPEHVAPVVHFRLSGGDDLSRMEKQIVKGGGEGCVIRRPRSKYRPGRCGDVIKIKRLTKDIERWQG
jgi:DNA ligase-1